MKKNRIIILTIVIAAIILIRFSPLGNTLSLHNLKKYSSLLLSFVHQHYLLSVLTYIATYMILTAVSFPGAAPLTLLGGFLFNVVPATCYVNIGATLGATGVFLATRFLFGKELHKKYKNQLVTFNKNIQENGLHYLLAIRLIPLFPFFLINILAGLTNLSTKTFMWTTSIGIIPGSIIYTFAGKNLMTISSVKDLLSGKILIIFLLFAMLSLAPVIVTFFGIMPVAKSKNYDKQ